MSSRRAYAPDPDKWVTTKKVDPKPPKQRPLVDARARVHHGIATPPPSTGRKRTVAEGLAGSNLSSAKRQSTQRRGPLDGTPLSQVSHGIKSYFTPPTTGPSTAKQRVNTSRPDGKVGVGLRQAVLPHTPPSVRPGDGQAQVATSGGAKLDPQTDADVGAWLSSKAKTRASPLQHPPSSSPRRRPAVTPLQNKRTPPRLSSPPIEYSIRQLTPVPAEILARHALLAGHDAERNRGAKSPWGNAFGDRDEDAVRQKRQRERQERNDKWKEERERKRLRLDVQDASKQDARDRVHGTRIQRELGQFKSLVELSSESDLMDESQSSSPSRAAPGHPLQSKRANVVPLRRFSSAVQEPVCERDSKWPHLASRREAPSSTTITTSPLVLPLAGKDNPQADNVIVVPSSQASDETPVKLTPRKRRQVVSPMDVTTPRKPKPRSPHHKVTPPKPRTPRHYDQHETLFVFPPPPPPKPVFSAEPSPKRASEWAPIDMEAETLMTWSLGGTGAASVMPQAAALEAATDAGGNPIRDDDMDSIAPSPPSQSFPHFVESTPPANSWATPRKGQVTDKDADLPSSPTPMRVARQMSLEGQENSPGPRVSPRRIKDLPLIRTSPTRSPVPRVSGGIPTPVRTSQLKRPNSKPLTRHTGSTTRRFNHALFSSLSDMAPKSDGSSSHQTHHAHLPPPPSQVSRTQRSKRSSGSDGRQQKLDAFGYFSVSKQPPPPDFDTRFSDEEDLDFGEEVNHEDDFEVPTKRQAFPLAGASSSLLRAIPEAPPHPHLRPAGVAELKKRSDAAMARHRAQTQHAEMDSEAEVVPREVALGGEELDTGVLDYGVDPDAAVGADFETRKERLAAAPNYDEPLEAPHDQELEMYAQRHNPDHDEAQPHPGETSTPLDWTTDLFFSDFSPLHFSSQSGASRLGDHPPSPVAHSRERERSIPKHSSSTGVSSSLDEDAPRVSESTRRWWDRLGASSEM